MGLLDDAIREHLELKRRHGADPGEVSAQEREAFGPGQMPAIPDAPAPAPAEAPGASATMPEDAPAPAEEPAAPYGDFDDDLPEASEALPSTREHRPPPVDDDIDWSDPAPLDDPAPAADAEGERDEDVLEETPEFLQETPEHDRLWFEQRPPKDFDF